MTFSPASTLLRTLSVLALCACAHAAPLDTLIFGDASSESAHSLITTDTEVVAGALGEPARRALPRASVDIYGGDFTFTITVDPIRRNYVSVKLWGGDDGDLQMGRFYLYVPKDGINYQVGYRHEGDYMPIAVTGTKPPLPGRFFYSTTLLPLEMTRGRTSITLKIVSTGRLYGLGSGGPPSGNYQYNMDRPSRLLYRAYTHVDPFLDVSGEVQGTTPAATARPSPGEEVMLAGGTFTNGVNGWINNRLNTATSVSAFGTSDIQYLAKAYTIPNLNSYQNAAVVDKVVALIDAFATDYFANPTTATSAGGNEGWGGRFGNIGRAIQLLQTPLAPYLDVTVNYGAAGGDRVRRAAWADILYASREFGRTTRDNRTLTNQCISADESIYKANRGLAVLGDARAFPEADAQRYLKEACGLLPWLGSDLTGGGSSKKFGSSYYQVTSKGLTREWGYVGNSYGEMAYHVADWYQMTGNVEFQQQAAKMARARAPFRRPSIAVDGANYYRTMEAIGLLAWRGVDESDGDYEDTIVYGDTTEWARGMRLAAVTGDPVLIGYAKQMLADNHYFRANISDGRIYRQEDALNAFVDYATVKAATDSGSRLPMTAGQPDFAWADEGNRIVALKSGNERLWISGYWQAKTGTGINGIARFHYAAANYDQWGVLETIPQYTSGGSYTRPANMIDKPEATQWGPPNPPTQAYGGEILPLGPVPADAGDDAPFRGKADYVTMRFGRFLIGVNAHASKTFVLRTPSSFSSALDLISGTTRSGTISVAPESSVALVLADTADLAPPPNAPLFIGATGTTSGMTVTWSAASGATSYTVRRATSSSGPFNVLASGVTGTTYSDSTATPGTPWYYQVSAVNAQGESDSSTVVEGLTLGLPSPWTNTDIGTATGGSASVNNGSYVIKGAGSDIGGTSDGFHFASQPLAGDGVFTVRLASRVIGGNVNDKVGIMMRSSTAANSAMAWVYIDASSGLARFGYRGATGGSTTNVNGTAITVPRWFRLQRAGNVFTGSVSADGTTWTTVSSATLSLPTSLQVGFAVCSRDAALVDTSTFDNVSLVTPPSITSATAASAPLNAAYSYAITATNNPSSFSASGLPGGLTLNPTTGVISGSATASGTFSVNLTATNAAGSGTATLTLQVSPLPVVSVHFKRSADTGMKASDLAGVKRVSGWNNVNGPVSSPATPTQTASNLLDHTGATVSGLALSITGGSGYNTVLINSSTTVTNEAALFAHAVDQREGTAGTFSVTGIPYPTYDVYVYVYGDQTTSNDRGGSITANGTTYWVRTGAATRITATDGTGYVISSDTTNAGASTTLGNTVRFTGLTGNLSMSYVAGNLGSTTQRLKLAGIQIVATSLPAPGTVAPAAPTGLTVTSGNNQVTLSWNLSVGATSYFVKRSTSAGGPFTTVASGLTALTYVDATASNGTSYYYVVTASNAIGESGNSSTSSAVTPAVPSVPVGISFDLRTATGKRLTLTDLAGAGTARFANWVPFIGPTGGSQTVTVSAPVVDSNGAAVTGIAATLVSGTTGTTHDRDGSLAAANDPQLFNSVLDQQNGTATTLTVTGIPYPTYDFYLYVYGDESASNANDRGGSVTVGGTTYYVRTGTATRVTASDGTGYIQSSDTNAANGASTQLGNYVRFTGLSGNLTASMVATNMGSSVQRLKIAGFQIVAPSTPVVASVPPAPTGVQAVASAGQVSILWNPANTATSYVIKRSASSAGPFTSIGSVTAANNSYVDTTVSNGVTYFYVVAAVNGVGTGADSSVVTATPVDPATLDTFGVKLRAYNTYGMAITDSAGVVRLPWWNNLVGPASEGEVVSTTRVTNHLGVPLNGVTVTWTAGSTTTGQYTNSGTLKFGPDKVTANALTHDENLYSSAFEQYNGAPSTLQITGIPYPSYDAIVYVYDNGSDKGGTITANGVTYGIRGGAGNPNVNGNGYVQSTDSATSGTAVQSGNYVRFSGLTGTLTATFNATAMGSSTQRLRIAGFQIVSNTPVPAPSAVPSAPASFTASGGNQQVALNWSLSATATSYRVYRNGSLLATVPSPGTSYADSAVTNGTSYAYTVTAVNAVGESNASPGASASPTAPSFTPKAGSVYQYSVQLRSYFGTAGNTWEIDPDRRAYLWVPPGVTKLQGVVLGLFNMLEQPMFEDPAIRQACADAGLGIVFISPGDSVYRTTTGTRNGGANTSPVDLNPNNYKSRDIDPATGTNYATDVNPSTGARFANQTEQAGAEVAEILRDLATESGYSELRYAPLMLVGHSAASPFALNVGLWNTSALTGRIFGVLSLKGNFANAPGIPFLNVAAEWQEISTWGNTWELNDTPNMRGIRALGLNSLSGVFVQGGSGHYAYDETQSGPIALFVKKAALARIPANWNASAIPVLNPLDPASGALVDVTKVGTGQSAAVPYADWIAAGKDPLRAYWYVDLELAQAICNQQNADFNRRPQVITAYQNATTTPNLGNGTNGSSDSGMVFFTATLQSDGATFQVRAASLNASPVSRLFHGQPVGMPTGSIEFKPGTSILRQTGVDTFRVVMDRGTLLKFADPWRPSVIAFHRGDSAYRPADRPIDIGNGTVPVNNTSGTAQTLAFTAPADQYADSLAPLTLSATATSGLPVDFWVVSGPYRISAANRSVIEPADFPAKPTYPIKVTVGAWQWGRPGTTAAAPIVYQTFLIQGPRPTISSAPSATAAFNTPFSYQITAANNPTSFGAANLPSGLVVNPTTGLIEGSPQAVGSFNVTLSATNAYGSATMSLSLTVAGQSYGNWAGARGLSSAQAGAAADPDGDGLANQLEFLLGFDPLLPNSTGLPRFGNESGQWVFRFTRDRTSAASYTVERSDDLVAWSPLVPTVESSTATAETLVALVPAGGSQRFVRLTSAGVSSVPQGFTTTSLVSGATTAFGILLDDTDATPVGLRAGRIEGLTATTVSHASGGWTGSLANPASPWALRFTTGAAAGRQFDLSGNTATTLTLSGASLVTQGVAVGDAFELVPLDTLGSLFGAAVLQGGTSPSTADVVQLRSGTAWVAYYYDTASGFWRRTTGPVVSADNIVVRTGSGLLVTRRGGTLPLTIIGRVLATPFRAAIANASTTAITPGYPTDATLSTLGLQSLLPGWRSGTATGTADSVSLYTGTSWTPYVFTGVRWQTAAGDPADSVAIPAGTVLLIQRPGSTSGTTELLRPQPY